MSGVDIYPQRIEANVFEYVVEVNTSHTPKEEVGHRQSWPNGLIIIIINFQHPHRENPTHH
jgi:hypothetical protein